MTIYDIVVPKDNMLRQINELVDFSFVHEEIALEKQIIKSRAIIVDATHAKARFNQQSPKEILMEKSKLLRKVVYQIDENMNDKFPSKTTTNQLADELVCCQKVIDQWKKKKPSANIQR